MDIEGGVLPPRTYTPPGQGLLSYSMSMDDLVTCHHLAVYQHASWDEVHVENHREMWTRFVDGDPLPCMARWCEDHQARHRCARANFRIVSAARRYTACGTVIPSPRHSDSTFHVLSRKLGLDRASQGDRLLPHEDGFIDIFGLFWNRREAWWIAEFNRQIVRREGLGSKRLYSEHLY